MPLSGGYTREWDETAPVGSSTQSATIDDIIRQIKTDIRERICDLFGMSEAQFDADPMEPQSVPFNTLPVRHVIGPWQHDMASIIAAGIGGISLRLPDSSFDNPNLNWPVLRAGKITGITAVATPNLSGGKITVSINKGAMNASGDPVVSEFVADVLAVDSAGGIASGIKSVVFDVDHIIAADDLLGISVSAEVGTATGAASEASVKFQVWLEITDDPPTS